MSGVLQPPLPSYAHEHEHGLDGQNAERDVRDEREESSDRHDRERRDHPVRAGRVTEPREELDRLVVEPSAGDAKSVAGDSESVDGECDAVVIPHRDGCERSIDSTSDRDRSPAWRSTRPPRLQH